MNDWDPECEALFEIRRRANDEPTSDDRRRVATRMAARLSAGAALVSAARTVHAGTTGTVASTGIVSKSSALLSLAKLLIPFLGLGAAASAVVATSWTLPPARDSGASFQLSGASPIQLLKPSQVSNLDPLAPFQIALDTTYAYVTVIGMNSSAVLKIDFTTNDVVTLAPNQGTPTAIAVDSSDVYWAEPDANEIRRVPIVGGPVTMLAKGANIGFIAVDDVAVYWIDVGTSPEYRDGTLMRVAK